MTRKEIIEAAASVFSEKGYHAASVQDIADAVGLQKASLYHHFESKQEILLELLDYALDTIIDHMGNVLSQPLPPDQKLRQAMITYLQTMAKYQAISAVLILEHRSLDPEMHSKHVDRRDRFERLWRDIIQEGKEAGIFTCTSPSLAGRAILGALNWTVTWYRSDGQLSAEQIADQFATQFIHGLLMREKEPL